MLSTEAYEKFKARILSGDLKPGQMISQRELAEFAGMSMGPARDAIQRLAFESLLRIHPNRGIQVTEDSYRMIRSAYQLRSVLEASAIERFVQVAEDETILAMIKETSELSEECQDGVSEEFCIRAIEADWKMHDSFIRSMDNELIDETYQANHARIMLTRLSNKNAKIRLALALKEHLEILEACLARDTDAAKSRLIEHIDLSKQKAMTGL